MRLPVSQTREGAKFAVRVAPRASRTYVAGVLGEGPEAILRIALNAPAVEGRANAALIEFLANLFGVRRAAIEMTTGLHARNKVILVRGRCAAEIAAAIESELT